MSNVMQTLCPCHARWAPKESDIGGPESRIPFRVRRSGSADVPQQERLQRSIQSRGGGLGRKGGVMVAEATITQSQITQFSLN
jgi:hypothetical protein